MLEFLDISGSLSYKWQYEVINGTFQLEVAIESYR